MAQGALSGYGDLLASINQEKELRERTDYTEDYKAAQLDPYQSLNLSFRQAGRQFGALANNLLGREEEADPRIVEYQKLQQVLTPYSDVDFSNPEAKSKAFYSIAKDLMRNGFSSQGFKMLEAAQDLEKGLAETKRIQAETARSDALAGKAIEETKREREELKRYMDNEGLSRQEAEAKVAEARAKAEAARALRRQRDAAAEGNRREVIGNTIVDYNVAPGEDPTLFELEESGGDDDDNAKNFRPTDDEWAMAERVLGAHVEWFDDITDEKTKELVIDFVATVYANLKGNNPKMMPGEAMRLAIQQVEEQYIEFGPPSRSWLGTLKQPKREFKWNKGKGAKPQGQNPAVKTYIPGKNGQPGSWR